MACSSCNSGCNSGCGSCGGCGSCSSCGGCGCNCNNCATEYCNGCTDPIYYRVVGGDTFYALAEKFGTTVECMIAENPGVAPLNLLVGTVLKICRGSHYAVGGCSSCGGCSSSGCSSCGGGCSGWVPY